MGAPPLFRTKRAASDRQRPYRPVLESLEERCLLSQGFAQVNLASDVLGLARVTDPSLVNPWGIALSPSGPFWFADNGSGVSDLRDGRGQFVPLVVTVPSAAGAGGTPTGTVFNGGDGFEISANGVSAPSRFLFATEEGTIAGWSAVVDLTHALVAVDNAPFGAVYKGLALAVGPGGRRFLYAANFHGGTIDVFDEDFRPVVRPGSFQDPSLPAGYAPFNIQNIDNLLFVTYAQQDEEGHDDVAGLGHGFIDVYDTDGNLLQRFASQGALNSPWGLALAPADFGPFGGALLVGNVGDGHISAYRLGSGAFLGQLADDSGTPIAISTLWALTFGNGHAGGDADTLFFTAGLDYEAHGLFGAIQAPHRRGADTAGAGAFDLNALGETRDYPIPPSGGPAFRAGSEDPFLPIADLLPLRESSLVLVPTLSPFAGPGSRIETPVPAPPGSISPGGSLLTAVPTPKTPVLPAGAGNASPGEGAQDDTVALDTFLNLNATRTVPRRAGVQRPGPSLHAADVPHSPPVDRAAGAEELLAGASVAELEAPPAEDQDPGVLPAPDRADEGLVAVPSESRPVSAADPAGSGGSVAARPGGGWANRIHLLLGISIPVVWACWAGHWWNAVRSGKPARTPTARVVPIMSGSRRDRA
jgi:uncharacterized protein (TIGR03118 family)